PIDAQSSAQIGLCDAIGTRCRKKISACVDTAVTRRRTVSGRSWKCRRAPTRDGDHAKNILFYASVYKARRRHGCRRVAVACGRAHAGGRVGCAPPEKNPARVLTVKKTVIRFLPADAACRSE